jgi:hypothetical protein
MSNKTNYRRDEKRRTEHGSRYENGENDRNSSRSRQKWKRRAHKALRRTGKPLSKYLYRKGKPLPLPSIENEE